jgi:hypothetical protein
MLKYRPSNLKQNCHPDRSVPGFPATLHWTWPRVRLSVRERRMKSINATKSHRKSGGAQWRDLLFLLAGSHILFNTYALKNADAPSAPLQR